MPYMASSKILAWADSLACADGSGICGEDASFSSEYEVMREEVEKSISLHGGVSTDWDLVLNTATTVLAEQSKDLWALCYGVRAVFELHGLKSCLAGFAVMNSLSETYWDDIHPSVKRVQRRCAPFKWLCDRLEPRLAAWNFTAEDPETLKQFRAELHRLQTLLDSKLDDEAPSFSALLRLVPEPVAAKETEVEAPASTIDPLPVTILPPVQISSAMIQSLDGDGRVPPAILPQLLRATQEQTQQLAVHYLAQDPLDWRVYWLHRASLWCTVTQLPPADSSGLTQLRRPVPNDKATAYAAEVGGKRYAETLPQLERSAGKAPFWFDGHYLVARCLEGLEAKPALQILRTVLGLLIARFPELPHYKFHDGSPFASPKTMEWLDGLQGAGEALVTHSQSDSVSCSESDREETLLQEAVLLNNEKNFQAGLQHLGTVHTGRSRAVIRHGLLRARYCLAAGKTRAAVRLLEVLYSQLERWDLLDWEPEISARILSLLLSSQGKQRGSQQEEMVRHLHWLHLDTALNTFKES